MSQPFSELRVLTVLHVAAAGLSYASTIALAHYLGVEDFGRYTYILVVASLFEQFVSFGSAVVAVRQYSQVGASYLPNLLFAKLANYSVVFAAALIIGAWTGDEIYLFAVLLALIGFSFASNFECLRQNRTYSVIYVVERFAFSLVVLAALALNVPGGLQFILGSLIVIQIASLLYQWRRSGAIRPLIELGVVARIYREGAAAVVFGISKFAYGGFTRLFIFNAIGATAAGEFAAAWQFLVLSTLYFAQVERAWRMPLVLSIRDRDEATFHKRVFELFFFLVLPAMVAATIFWYFGEAIVLLMFPDEFALAGQLMPYIGVYFIIAALDVGAVLMGFSLGMHKQISATYLIFGSLVVLFTIFVLENPSVYEVITVCISFHAACVLATFVLVWIRKVDHFSRSGEPVGVDAGAR